MVHLPPLLLLSFPSMAAVKSNENDLSVVHYLNTIKSSSRTPFELQFNFFVTDSGSC